MNKRISKKLKQFLDRRNLSYEYDLEEHSACFDKGCSHTYKAIHIRPNNIKRLKFSFERSMEDDEIIKHLERELAFIG